MMNVRRRRTALWVLALGLAVLLTAGSAEADDYRHRGHRHVHHHHHDCDPTPSCTPCDMARSCGYGYRRGRAFGGSWAVLRRYINPGTSLLRYFYVRSYFLRRYPHLFAQGEPARGTEIESSHFLHPQYDAAAHPLTARQHLNLGMWQLHLGEYKEARASFLRVPAKSAELPQARYGALMSAMSLSDWDAAAKDLAVLAEQGELKAEDRLDVDGLFGETGKLANIQRTVKEHVRWQAHDGEGLLAAGWLFASTGDKRLAKAYLRKATRLLPGHPAGRLLLEHVEGKAPAVTKPAKETAPIEQPKIRAPKAPQGVVADARKTITVADSR